MLIVSVVIRFDILEGLLDLVAVVGILAGLVMTAVGVFMLGRDEGWWNQLSSQVGSTPPPPGSPPGGIVGPPQYPAGPAAPAAYQDAPLSPVDAPVDAPPPQYPAGPAAPAAYQERSAVARRRACRRPGSSVPGRPGGLSGALRRRL